MPEFSEEQVSIATTEFSTHAASEVNRSYMAGLDDTASVSGAGSIREDSPVSSSMAVAHGHASDKRLKDFAGEDQSIFESESDDISIEGAVTTEEDEKELVFVKPTKPAPRKKIVTSKIEADISADITSAKETTDIQM